MTGGLIVFTAFIINKREHPKPNTPVWTLVLLARHQLDPRTQKRLGPDGRYKSKNIDLLEKLEAALDYSPGKVWSTLGYSWT